MQVDITLLKNFSYLEDREPGTILNHFCEHYWRENRVGSVSSDLINFVVLVANTIQLMVYVKVLDGPNSKAYARSVWLNLIGSSK